MADPEGKLGFAHKSDTQQFPSLSLGSPASRYHEGALISREKDARVFLKIMTMILIIEVPPPSAPKLKLKQSGEINMAPLQEQYANL